MITFVTSKDQAAFGQLIRNDEVFRRQFFNWYSVHQPFYAHKYELNQETLSTVCVEENWNPPSYMTEIRIRCSEIDPETHLPRDIDWVRMHVPCDTNYGLPDGEPTFSMNGGWIKHRDGSWGCHT